MRRWVYLTVVFLLGFWSQGTAQEGAGQSGEVVFKEIIISSEPLEPETEKVGKEVLDFGTYVNIGEVLDALPGVSVVRRGAGATEPVIRGLGWERVQTQVGPVPVYGGCPSRMDPPVTYLLPDSAQDVTVVKGVPSVTMGPGGTGGRIMVSTDFQRDPHAPPEVRGWLSSTYNGARKGYLGGIGTKGGNEWVDYYAVFNGLSYGDYKSADGTDVPASQKEYGGAISLGFRPAENHRWWHGLIGVRDEGKEFPAVPMDSVHTTTWIYHTGYRMDFPGNTLESLEFTGGFSLLDHLMDNSHKPNRWMMKGSASTDADSFAGRAKQNWRINPSMLLTTGLDYYHLARDGMRERFMPLMPNPGPFFDHIWPDATQADVGWFAEWNMDLAPRWTLRLGGRMDYALSSAEAVNDLGVGGVSVRQQFIRFYGPEAGKVDRDELLGSGNALLEWQPIDPLFIHLGGGATSRPAGITERFYAFSPAPGGYQIGNPSLDPEIKYEVNWGADWRRSWGTVGISFFYSWVNDYILQTKVGDFADGLPVRGFRNIDAELYGAELGAVLRPFKHWTFPLSLSYVRGRNSSEDRDLPEIPPLEGRAAARFEHGTGVPWWIEFGGRFTAPQKDVDDWFPEDETAGYAVFHLYAGCRPVKNLRIQVGIDNLFNKEYHEHLTREAVFAGGDLLAGDEVPAPGISFFAVGRYDF